MRASRCCPVTTFASGCRSVPSRRCSSRKSLSAATRGGRYVLTVNADSVVEQRRVTLGQTFGELCVIESGLKPDERVVVAGILDAIPGQKVDPQMQTPKSAAAGSTAPQ